MSTKGRARESKRLEFQKYEGHVMRYLPGRINDTFLQVTTDMEGLRQRIPFRLGDAEDDENIVLDEQRKNKTLFSVIVALIFD